MFRQHFSSKVQLMRHIARELAIPEVRVAIRHDKNGWVCESTHPKRCACGACK